VFIQRTVEVQVIGLQMSVPLKRYNCYTEKNIVIVLRLIFLGNVTQTFQK